MNIKKLSLYWWCQIIGWSFNAIANIINGLFDSYYPYSLSYHGLGADIFLLRLFIITLLGIVLTHLMRGIIIKLNILQKKINYQAIYFLGITLVFTILFSFSNLSICKLFGLLRNEELTRPFIFLMYSAIFFSFLDLFFWNLGYYVYHYIQKDHKQQLEKINLQNELKLQKLENEKNKAELLQQASELEMQALRSQINPHFIFNCLNSIKLYATQNDINAATDYLTKFSRLIRQVLENSRSDQISLASELEVLRLYIEMEAMRFKEKLKYSISVESNVEADYIEIPPLLLQPYVENAIWHGLMPKEEGGHLDIGAAMKDDSILIITIKDDGIGRAGSPELKSKIATQHKSFGMKITSERMALINQMHNTASTVTIDDLTDDKGEAAGTLVTIQIQGLMNSDV